MNHCNQCIHWDEDSMDQEGRARCEVPLNIPEQNNAKVFIYVRGDYSCGHFKAKQVTSK
jgi:hypothetical protein